MNYQTIIYEKDQHVGWIRLNRPERMNAVIEEMYTEIQDVLQRILEDDQVRAVILTGTSFEKAGILKQTFCAGADLKKHGAGERTAKDKRAYIELAHDTCRQLFNFPKPTIAAVNGAARGAGVEMAFCCDFIFMAAQATMAFPEIGLGTCVGGGVTAHLPRMIGMARAKELIYTGRIIDGPGAAAMGIALATFPMDTFFKEVRSFAAMLGEKAPISLKLVKELIHEPSSKPIEHVLDSETDAILHCMETEDWHEGIQSFSEKRKPLFKGR